MLESHLLYIWYFGEGLRQSGYDLSWWYGYKVYTSMILLLFSVYQVV